MKGERRRADRAVGRNTKRNAASVAGGERAGEVFILNIVGSQRREGSMLSLANSCQNSNHSVMDQLEASQRITWTS